MYLIELCTALMLFKYEIRIILREASETRPRVLAARFIYRRHSYCYSSESARIEYFPTLFRGWCCWVAVWDEDGAHMGMSLRAFLIGYIIQEQFEHTSAASQSDVRHFDTHIVVVCMCVSAAD